MGESECRGDAGGRGLEGLTSLGLSVKGLSSSYVTGSLTAHSLAKRRPGLDLKLAGEDDQCRGDESESESGLTESEMSVDRAGAAKAATADRPRATRNMLHERKKRSVRRAWASGTVRSSPVNEILGGG